MKKIIIALAVLCCVPLANAQVKTDDIMKKVQAAEETVANPRKADNLAAWLKVGEAYLNAYSEILGGGWIGGSREEFERLVLKNDPALETKEVTIGGTTYLVDVYPTRNYYYDENLLLTVVEITNPIYPDALEKSLAAYTRSHELDPKGTKGKEIGDQMQKIADYYLNEGVNNYMLRNLETASDCFEKAYYASICEPLNFPNFQALYNAGFTACEDQNFARAKDFFEMALKEGYVEEGDTFAKLGECYLGLGDGEKAMSYLAEGFTQFPDNEGILYSMISYYITSGESSDQLFILLDQAKAKNPDNAVLYYVEGNARLELGDVDGAINAYNDAMKVDPSYEYSYIGMALLYCKLADQIAEEYDRVDVKDIETLDRLEEEFNQTYLTAADYFEKGFDATKSDEMKVNISEYLKNIFFRFRDKSPYGEKYEKYNSVFTNGL